jgi:hypothetical protein
MKYAITALLVVVISEVAKRSDRLGSLVAALPTITVLTLIWLYLEKQPPEKINNHVWYTFWIALLFSCILTAGLFAMLAWALNKFGIRLW